MIGGVVVRRNCSLNARLPPLPELASLAPRDDTVNHVASSDGVCAAVHAHNKKYIITIPIIANSNVAMYHDALNNAPPTPDAAHVPGCATAVNKPIGDTHTSAHIPNAIYHIIIKHTRVRVQVTRT